MLREVWLFIQSVEKLVSDGFLFSWEGGEGMWSEDGCGKVFWRGGEGLQGCR